MFNHAVYQHNRVVADRRQLRRSDPLGSWIDDVPAGQAQIRPEDLAWLHTLPEELARGGSALGGASLYYEPEYY